MNQVGQYTLMAAWILTLAAFVLSVLSALNYKKLSDYCQALSVGGCISSIVSVLALAAVFLQNDYTNQYVWQHSNREMSWIYKITAVWGGMDGSMLLWAAILATATLIALLKINDLPENQRHWYIAVLSSSLLFFLTVTLFLSNPFRYIQADFIPPEGNGLNPLLQNPYMAIHPPMLYLGFTTFAIPFALCLSALLSKNLDNNWLLAGRRWSIIAWMFLTIGITLGGHWAYLELGWGGFWAWDPVENSSFLPWLTATAFLHSVMVQERKGMLKVWNIWLIVITYALTIFGTFLTRSGVVQSVHSFASSDIGWIFLVYLAIILLITLCLNILRAKDLKSERHIESFFSRETAFLLNNLFFLSICFATFWGVMFPVFSEALTGSKQNTGIPFFNAINIPLFLGLIALMSIAPFIAWKKSSLTQIKATFSWPLIISLIFGLIIIFAGIQSFQPFLAYTLAFFAITTIFFEYHRAVKARKDAAGYIKAGAELIKTQRSRYGGYLVHIGVAVACIAITASMAAKVEREFTLDVGERFPAGRFELELTKIYEEDTPNYLALNAMVTAYANNEIYTELHPELRHYKRNRENTTEVALKMGPREDLYLVIAGLDENGKRATFKVFINPLQVWLWFGVLIMIAGTLLVLSDRRRFQNTKIVDE